MIDKRIGKRFKQRREELGLTQEQLAEKLGLTVNYISTIECGKSFPRCEKLILLLNGLETTADAIFCDVVDKSTVFESSILSQKLKGLPSEEQIRILNMVDFMIKEAQKH